MQETVRPRGTDKAKVIKTESIIKNEPEQVVNNILAMCKIVEIIK